MIPFYQIAFGICAGLVVFLLARPSRQIHYYESGNNGRPRQPSNNNNNSNESSGDGNPKTKIVPETKPGTKCVICTEAMQKDKMKRLPCGHAIHTNCYEQIRDLSDDCIICRKPLNH